jgi:hypothetical protein
MIGFDEFKGLFTCVKLPPTLTRAGWQWRCALRGDRAAAASRRSRRGASERSVLPEGGGVLALVCQAGSGGSANRRSHRDDDQPDGVP